MSAGHCGQQGKVTGLNAAKKSEQSLGYGNIYEVYFKINSEHFRRMFFQPNIVYEIISGIV